MLASDRHSRLLSPRAACRLLGTECICFTHSFYSKVDDSDEVATDARKAGVPLFAQCPMLSPNDVDGVNMQLYRWHFRSASLGYAIIARELCQC